MLFVVHRVWFVLSSGFIYHGVWCTLLWVLLFCLCLNALLPFELVDGMIALLHFTRVKKTTT